MGLNKNIDLIAKFVLGPLVLLLLCVAIYHQVLRQPDWRHSLQQISGVLRGQAWGRIGLVIVLMLLNWGIEARKWQLVMKPLQSVTFGRSFRATLTGTSFASFTPNRMGEYLGRILYLEPDKRLRSIPLTILCSVAQTLVTLLAGLAGLFLLGDHLRKHSPAGNPLPPLGLPILEAATTLALLACAICYFRISWLVRFCERHPFWGKLNAFVKVLEELHPGRLAHLLWLSCIRYLVFIMQYILLFSVFDVPLSWLEAFAGVSVMFLVMAIVPTFGFLTELGLRWAASIEIIQLLSGNRMGILAVSFSVWLVNLVIPALAGSLLILGVKLYRSR